jgi:signal recognition particle subunit SRP54
MAFELLGDKLQAIVKKVKGQSKLTEQNMEEMIKEIRISLLEADVNYKVVKEFTNNVKEQAIGQNVLSTLSPGQMILKIIKDELVKLLGEENDALNISGLTSVMMVGLQGSGKTTTSAKIANLLRNVKSNFFFVVLVVVLYKIVKEILSQSHLFCYKKKKSDIRY